MPESKIAGFSRLSMFGLSHLVGSVAARPDRFDKLPLILKHTLGVDWLRVAVLQVRPGNEGIVREVSCPLDDAHAMTPGELLAWVSLRGSFVGHPGGELIKEDLPGDERRILCHVERGSFVLVRHGSMGLSETLKGLLDTLAAHVAQAIRLSLLWQAEPTDLGDPLSQLTRKEWEVFQALQTADGEKQMAARLGLSANTLHVHVKKIYRKLDVRSRISLIDLCRSLEHSRMVKTAPRAVATVSTQFPAANMAFAV